jgi:gliding motility-associated-like protein
MIRNATLSAFLVFCSSFAMSQNYNMNANTPLITTCSGIFYDSGGPNGNYGSNQNLTTTICPVVSQGTHVQLTFNGINLGWIFTDDLCFFDGNNVSAPSLGCADDFQNSSTFIIQATSANPTGCITIKFNSGSLDNGAGWAATIKCVAACQTILAHLADSEPGVVPADTGWIDICPGQEVSFTGAGEYPQNGTTYNHSDLTSTFSWDFGDGVLEQGKTVSHVFNEPGGYIVNLTIKDQFGCKSINSINQRIRVAGRPDFMIGDYTHQVCSGDTVALNALTNTLADEFAVSVQADTGAFQNGAIRSDSLPLPDGNGASYQTTLTFSDFTPGQTLTNVNDLLGIWVNMEHSWMRDLEMNITCPNGTNVILHNFAGQNGGQVYLGQPNDFDNSFPVPGAGYDYGWQVTPDYNYTMIQYANAFLPPTLPSGSYRSFQPLSNLVGCPLNGDWTIEVVDSWPADNGFIFSWSLEFDPDLYPNLETFIPLITDWSWNPNATTIYSEPDSILVSPINAGEVAYTFTVTDTFGCVWDTMISIDVLPFTHPDCHECQGTLASLQDTTVCQGEQVTLNASAFAPNNTRVTFESYDNYEIGNSNHPPAMPYDGVISVNSILPATITNPNLDIVSVCLDLETDATTDIQLYLVSPNNQVMMLSTDNGGNGDNFHNTCFAPTATVPITAGTAPFTGNYRPEGNWAVLNGQPINGDWKLRISDKAGASQMGKLLSWSISFNSQNNLTYTWSPGAGLSCTNCPNPVATPMGNGEYIVSTLDSYGCVLSDTMAVNTLDVFDAPTVNCQILPGGIAEIDWNEANQGVGYEININNAGWQTPNNGNLAHTISGLTNGTQLNIQVRAKVNGAACVVNIGASFCEYLFCPIDLTPMTPGPYAVTCANSCDENIQLNVVNGALPYQFTIANLTTGNVTNQTSDLLSNLCAGNYIIAVQDGGGCLDTLLLNVTAPPPLTLVLNQTSQPSCNGGSNGCAMVSAGGGTGPYAYVWGNPNMSTGPNICTLPAGPISVTATDANGCTGIASVLMTEPSGITLNFTQTNVGCKGESTGTATVNATGGVGNYTYQWSGGNAPNAPTTGGLQAGVFSVTVMDANSCDAFGNVTISEPSTGVEVTASQTVVSCFEENLSEATASPNGGTGAYNYMWTPGGQTGQVATNLMPGNYTVVVSDASGCSATASVAIEQWDSIFISISFVPPTCHSSVDGEMAANIVTGGNGSYSYAWNNGDMDDFANGLQGGLTYTVTVTDGQGCFNTLSRLLPDPPAIEIITAITDARCFGTMDGIATITDVLNAKGNVIYQWDVNALSQKTAMADSLFAGEYAVVVVDSAGCSASTLVTVGQPSPITAQFEVVDNICFGYDDGVAALTATGGVGGYTYRWSNGSTDGKVANLNAGTWIVTITDANGCEKIDSARIAEPLRLDSEISVKDVSCFGDRDGSITVEAMGGTPPFLYSLNGNQFFGSSTFIAQKAGDYTVYIKDGNGCIFQSPTTVNEPPEMTVDILINGEPLFEQMIMDGDEVVLDPIVSNATGMVDYAWTAGWCSTLFCDTLSDCAGLVTCETPIARPGYTNDYYLRVTDENGCSAEDQVQIHVKKERRVVVPTGFTPNNDNLNSLLSVHGKSGTMIKLFQVFDRWGELLFEDFDIPINDTTRGWDGNFKNKEMSSGVYVWYVEAEYSDGMKETYKGETTLIR